MIKRDWKVGAVIGEVMHGPAAGLPDHVGDCQHRSQCVPVYERHLCERMSTWVITHPRVCIR